MATPQAKKKNGQSTTKISKKASLKMPSPKKSKSKEKKSKALDKKSQILVAHQDDETLSFEEVKLRDSQSFGKPATVPA